MVTNTPEEFFKFVQEEFTKFAPVIKMAVLEVEQRSNKVRINFEPRRRAYCGVAPESLTAFAHLTPSDLRNAANC